jgi:serine/threonine protein phosphatase PrpC
VPQAGSKHVDAASFLVEQALARGSSDNITCIVVFL